MNNKINDTGQKLDKVKWCIAILLLIAGFVANYYFITQPLALRIAGWIILLCIIFFIILQTAQGRAFWAFAKESRAELQRVVWPNRKETIQTTIVVFVMVIVLALILWGVDSILLWLISWFTGRGGS